MKEPDIQIIDTIRSREDLEWLVGNLFGMIAVQYIDDDQLKWFNGLRNPGAHELRELTGSQDWSDYFQEVSDCEVDIPFAINPDTFTAAIMKGFRTSLSATFDTVAEYDAKYKAGII